MAKEFMSIGCTPACEECVQVSKTNDYFHAMLAECERYRVMLTAKFADCIKVNLKVKKFPHDFGEYAEVCAEYDSNDNEAEAQAIHIQNNSPMYWTDTHIVKFDYEDYKDEYEEEEYEA